MGREASLEVEKVECKFSNLTSKKKQQQINRKRSFAHSNLLIYWKYSDFMLQIQIQLPLFQTMRVVCVPFAPLKPTSLITSPQFKWLCYQKVLMDRRLVFPILFCKQSFIYLESEKVGPFKRHICTLYISVCRKHPLHTHTHTHIFIGWCGTWMSNTSIFPLICSNQITNLLYHNSSLL